MIFVEVFAWWYAAGWAGLVRNVVGKVGSVLEFFSVGTLLKTLFDPFRQIDAGRLRGGSLQAQLQAFGNRLFSRIIGAVIRTVVIIAGLVAALFAALLAILQIVIWPLLPLLPLAGLWLSLAGVTL